MIRISRRAFTTFAVGSAAAAVLAACGQAAPTAAPTAPAAAPTAPAKAAEAPKPAAAPAATAAPAAAAPAQAGAGGTEIRLGTWASSTLFEVIKAQIADFETRADGKVKIKTEVAPWAQYWDKMQVQVAGGTTPDVVWMSGATFLDLNDKGAFRELSDYSKADKNLKLDEMWNEPLYTAQGKLWAVPYTASVDAMYYNKTMLKEAGIPEPPTDWNASTWTWDDFRKAALQLTGKDKNGKPRWGVAHYNSIQGGWGEFVQSNGGHVLNDAHTEALTDQPEFIEAIQFIVDMIHKDKSSIRPGDPQAALGADILDNFQAGRVGFYFVNNSRIAAYNTIKDFEWDVAVPPRSGTKPRQVTWVQNPYCMASATKTPDAAWQFLNYVVSKPGQDFMGSAKLIMPSLKSAAYDPNTYLKAPPGNTKVFPDAMDKHVTDLQFTKTWLRYVQVSVEQLDPAFLGEKSPADAAKATKREIDKVLKGV